MFFDRGAFDGCRIDLHPQGNEDFLTLVPNPVTVAEAAPPGELAQVDPEVFPVALQFDGQRILVEYGANEWNTVHPLCSQTLQRISERLGQVESGAWHSPRPASSDSRKRQVAQALVFGSRASS
ncbi:hypothetical protein AWY79_00160 [Pseudodesulfovibrio indicus]|uniref:Uncharacterized protein n=1 Tax=Pseudodesulfovibrio indicus TaxID=1716143 RepID=A0ABM5YQQ4_9BACT|nr:hypothetical protein AWY79_00160 [Pseudodesulfovibrio indicus]